MNQQQIPTSEVLNKAADLIEERGWVQGANGWPSTVESTHSLCLEGGILAAMGLDVESAQTDRTKDVPNTCAAGVAVREYLALREEEYLYEWNDDLGLFLHGRAGAKSATQVIEVLRAAAVIEAAREEQDAAWETYAPNVEVIPAHKVAS